MTQFPTLAPDRLHQMFLVLSAHMSNPNGDPDADNAPRVNPYNGHGFISAASLKRKARDYTQDKMKGAQGFELLIRHGEVIATTAYTAMREAGIQVSEATPLDDEERAELLDVGGTLPPEFTVGESGVSYDQTLSNKTLKQVWVDLTEAGVSAPTLQKLQDLAANKKGDKKPVRRDEVQAKAVPLMAERFWDARVFGFTAPDSAGKMRGPVQVADALSIAPVNIVEQGITRVARGTTSEKDGNANMGRKLVVDHAVYVAQVFVNPSLAAAHGVTPEDLSLLVEGLYHGQDLARSSARPDVRVEALVILSHDSKYGSHPFHLLSQRLQVEHDGRYGVSVQFDAADLNGVTVTTLR